ncbi:MAG: CapA family protein [Wujia sp.]
MRKFIITLIILTFVAITALLIVNVRDRHTTDTPDTSTTKPMDITDSDTPDNPPVSTASTTEAVTTEAAPITFTIRMNFVGDVLLAGNETATSSIDAMASSQSDTYFFENVRNIFLNDDITVANSENVFSDNENLVKADKGEAKAKEDYDNAMAEYNSAVTLAEQTGTAVGMEMPEYTFRAFWFRTKAANANLLSENGVDIVSIDNNHTYDFGTDGNMDTRAALEVAGVDWGKDGKIVYREINGFRLAFVFGSMYSAGGEYAMLLDLEEAKQNSDYQIVYFHGGTEKVHTVEDWKQASCHNLVDNGADLVIGSHPHVLQPMETYNGVNIIYSLGNFIFGGNNYPENRTVIYNQTLTITQDPNTHALSVTNTDFSITPCYVYTGESNNYQPYIIENEEDKQLVLDFMQGKRELPY